MKDISSPTKSLSKDEKEVLSVLVEDIHKQFRESVANTRGLSNEEAVSVSDGRVFSGKQALNLRLIDELGGLASAIEYIEKEIGLSDLDLEYYPIIEKKLFDNLIPSIKNSVFSNIMNKKLFYLYSPKI